MERCDAREVLRSDHFSEQAAKIQRRREPNGKSRRASLVARKSVFNKGSKTIESDEESGACGGGSAHVVSDGIEDDDGSHLFAERRAKQIESEVQE